MPCLTVVAGGSRAVIAIPSTLDGWSDWTVEDLLQHELPRRLPDAAEAGDLEQLRDGAGHLLHRALLLSSLGLHPGQVLHAMSRRDGADAIPESQDFGPAGGGARSWALDAVNIALREKGAVLGDLESLRDAASSATSNGGSSTARSDRTLASLTGAIQRRGEIVDRVDASFDAGLHELDRPPTKRRPVSEWPLAPYSALRGSADLPPYHEQRYTVDNHTADAPLVRRRAHAARCPSREPASDRFLNPTHTARSGPQLPRPRDASFGLSFVAEQQPEDGGSIMRERKNLQIMMKVMPTKRSAMGGMPLRNTDRAFTTAPICSVLLSLFPVPQCALALTRVGALCWTQRWQLGPSGSQSRATRCLCPLSRRRLRRRRSRSARTRHASCGPPRTTSSELRVDPSLLGLLNLSWLLVAARGRFAVRCAGSWRSVSSRTLFRPPVCGSATESCQLSPKIRLPKENTGSQAKHLYIAATAVTQQPRPTAAAHSIVLPTNEVAK